MAADDGTTSTGSRTRSPEHPMFDLESALAKAQVLYDKERLHWVPVTTAMGHLGYTAKSSGGQRNVAALLHFNLLDEEGKGSSRKVKISALARDILIDKREDSSERDTKVREAALAPRIHKDLYALWGGSLPSPETLEYELVSQFSFRYDAAPGFAEEVRKTWAFAQLEKADTVSSDKEEVPPPPPALRPSQAGPAAAAPATPPAPGVPPMPVMSAGEVLDLPIPLVSGGTAVLRTPRRLSAADFAILRGMITIMLDGYRDAIVEAGPPPATGPAPASSQPAIVDSAGQEVRPGRLVQWFSGGVARFQKPRRVSRTEQGFVFVENEDTGIPAEQVVVMKDPA